MRKTDKKPSGGMSWRQFIMGPGRTDALERKARWELEEEEERLRREQESKALRSSQRVRKPEQLESSNRAEERNREDAERSARESNVKKLSALQNETKTVNGKKTFMSDEEYRSTINLQLATGDNKNWWQKEAQEFRDDWAHHESDWWLAKPFNWFIKAGGGFLAKAFSDIGDDIARKENEKRDKERKEYLSQFTKLAYQDAKIRNLNLAAENMFNAGTYKLDDFMAGLNEEQQKSIANREQEYRNLIGPSLETVATHQQYLNDATLLLQGFANQSAPNRPDNYALRFTRDRYGRLNGVDFPWLNDFWTLAMENMNEVQRDEFAGMQTRFNERLFHADNASNYYAALQDLQRIPRWNALLDKYQRTPLLLTTWEQSTILDLLGKDIADVTYADIEQKREQLKSREMEIPATLSRFKKDADFIESFDTSTSPVSYVHKHILDFINRGFDWINPGWSANLADDVESLDIKLDGLKSASLDRKQLILQEYKEAGENKRESWLRGIEENEKDLQDWKDKHHVTDYFKFKMEHSDGSFYKPDTWLYKNANLWGSSQSSWIKQTTSLGLNTLIAATPVGSVAAGISQAGIGATSLGLGYSSSSDETNAEVAQNYRERLKSVLKSRKLTKEFLHNAPESVKSNIDDAVTEYTLRPWELGNRLTLEAVFDSLHGVNSLYQDGMAAVFGGEIAEMYLQISPFAAYARAAKPSSVLGHAAQAGARATTVSPTLGAAAFAGSAAIRAASRSLSETAVGKALANLTKNFVNFSKKIPERLLGEAKYNKMLNMARKTNSNVFGANSVPHRVLSAEQYVKYQTLKDYGKDVASRTIGSSISEGIEEGNQYILGQKFIRGDYDNDVHKGLLDASRLYNDMQAGVQSAIAMSTLLPFMPALVKDADLIENIKGGMLGGMFQTGMQRAIFGIIPAAQQMRMQDFVANEIQLEKQAQLDDYQKAKVYARKASDNAAAGRMMLAFDRYAEAVLNQVNRGEGDITQDMVDLIKALKKIAENVINLANSSDIIARANALGMKYGTDKFYQYVGAINMFQTSRTQAEERNNDAIAKSNETINSTRSPFKIDENGLVVSETVLNGGVKMQRAVKSITDAKGNPLSGQALLDASEENWKRNIHLFARIASLQSLRDYLSEAVTNDDIDSRTKKDLRFLLNRVNRLLRSELLNINDEHKEDVEKNAALYLSHLENSEEILRAMHQEITSLIDLDYHDAMLKGLLGELTDFAGGTSDKLEDFVHSGYAHPESVVDDIENTVDSDYKLANDIEQDWLYQYDLLDDTVLDKKEQVRRKIRERKAALDAKKAQEDILDQMLEEEDVVDDEDLINYAGSYTLNLTAEEPTTEELPVTDLSLIFDVPLVDEEEQEIDNKKLISRFSQRLMSDIRKKAKNIRARSERAKRVGSNPTVIEPKKQKYQSPESILKNTPENVLDIFAGLEDLLQQFANIQEMDLIDVREETLWKVKDLEDRINMWMMNTLANLDFSSINLDEAEMFNIEAKAILDGLKIEIETSNSKINRARINFSDAKTLRRSTYTNEDIERARLKEEEKYEKDVRATFFILTNELYKIGNEIQSGLHIQNDDLDSPTATRIDEILATLDKLIDDAFEVGIVFELKDIDTYTAAKRWFANKEGLTGRKSQPVPVLKPQPVMSTTTTAVVSYLNSSEYGNGVNQSTAEDGTKLSDVIGNPDFIQKGQFILSPIKQKQRASTVTKIAITVEYNGKKFSPIVLDSLMMNKTQSGKDFWAAVQKAYNTNAIGEDQILIPGRVFRTVGIQHHGGVFGSVLSKNLISIDRKDGVMNLYDVDFTRTQRTFGFTTAKQSSNNAYTTVVAAPDGTTLYTFNGDRNFEGALFMMLDRKYAEMNPNKPARIPILLRAKKMSEGDAQLIADIFSGKYNPRGLSGRSALTETVYVDGENTGITGLDLIKVLIPQRGAKDLYSNRLHFDIDQVSGLLQIIGRIKGDDQSMEPKVRQFDMSTESGRAAFVEFAKTNIEVAIDKLFMMQRFGYNQHTLDFPFDKLFKAPAMIRRINAGELIRFGNSCIAIDRTDIVNPNDENDQRGLSGLAWMMKNGLLETDFDGVTDINLGVDVEEGVKIIDRTPQNIDTTAGEQEQLSRALAETGYTEEELAQFFDKAVSNLTAGRKINEVEVRKNLARILGVDFAYDSEKTLVIDAVIDTAADGFVIGRCYHDSIVLSTQAEAGTEYHEAFHRILEIVSPKRLRDAVYKAYRSNKEGAKSKSDAEIAELLADEFMYFAMNRPTFKLPHSIKEAFLMVKDYINFVKKIGSFRLYLMYGFTNSGLINKLFNVNKERQDTFKKLHSSGMNKVIHGKEFDKIINSAMYRDLKNSLIYLIFKSKVIDIAGRNIQELDISKEFIINSKIYEKWMEDENIPQSTKDAINQLLDNWELIKPDIAASISKFTTDVKAKIEEDNIDDANGDEESIAGAAIGDHTRSSYEFSQFSRATSRVKFFFSAIPNSKWVKVDGKSVPQYQLNKQGLPEFANPNILFNTILNKLHSCQTYQELLDGLEKLGYSDARIYHVYRRIKTIYDRVLNGQASAEEEGILTLIKTIIHSAKNEFLLASSKKLGDRYTIQMQSTDAEYNARQYIQDWQQLFESGVSAYITRGESGEYVMKNNYRPSIFGKISDEINAMAEAVTDPNVDHERIKFRVVKMLNSLGIQFDLGALDYMLRFKYGSSDAIGLLKMFSDPNFNIIGLGNSLRILYDASGNLIQKNIRGLFDKIGFVRELANWKYEYRHAHDQLTVLAANDNRYYVISENNHITDQTDHLNRKDEYFDELCAFNYNLYEVGDAMQVGSKRTIGSLVLKYLSQDGYLNPIQVMTFAGFKTDEAGDAGQDYADINAREDYVAKASMLLQGAMVFPTMSDKKTWTFLTGVPMPGLKFERVRVNGLLQMVCNLNIAESGLIPQETVDLMWEYAMCERKAIAETLAIVRGGETENGTVPPLSDDKKVVNYHKATVKIGDKEYPIIQGARFSSLLGVWNGGKFIEFNRVLDENGKYLSEEDNLAIADQYFFDQPVDVQKNLIRQLLTNRVYDEIRKCERLGLISKDGQGFYSNLGLDQMSVDAVMSAFIGNRTPTPADRSVAVCAVIADICCKHIISLQEVERLYSGHPAAYNWVYDEKGRLIDRSTDQHKRLGGLVSTGTNNDLEINGIPDEYTCAEVDNDEPPAKNLEALSELMCEGEIRASYILSLLAEKNISFEDDELAREIVKEADAKTLDEIRTEIGDELYAVLKARGEKKAAAFKKVDVADGAAYISDKMAENLLRMVGAWNDQIVTAFKVLRGEPVNGRVYTTKDIRELSSAYELVYTTVIGNQKYTAYGLRLSSGALVPYYDKMALFPMFKCMCTGKMADMYELMKQQGVDMVMVNSAVKTGSMGSKPITWGPDFKFNSYKLKYSQIRKQFNTDPKEAELMKVGTQSAKIAMSALIAGRTYTVNGQSQTSTEMRDAIMEDQRKLSDLGLAEFEDEIFDVKRDEHGGVISKELNVEKFSEMLTEELISRGASSELLDAVSIENGKMKMPLAALSGMSWILSIIASVVNKRIVDIRIPGSAYIQRSAWGVEGPSIISDENIPPSLYGGKPLLMINENGSMDCVLSIDFFEHLIPKVVKRDEQGHIIYQVDDDGHFILNKEGNRKPVMERMPFEKARQWLLDNGIIGGEPTIFGYRIPTQAISSIHALRCVDVLPVVRDTVILPAEFTKITGADFDIDKLFLSTYFWQKKDGKMTTEFEKGTKEYYANDLIRRYMTLLTDLDENGKSRNTHVLHASIDGDTKLLTDVLHDLEEGVEKDPIAPYMDYTLAVHNSTKEEFIAGKFGIGPFALNNNSQILTTLYGVEFSPTTRGRMNILGRLGLTSLHEYTDRDGNQIMSWLSGLINANVDVAKDPYITRLGVNKYTYNLTNLLIRTGLGKTTLYMLTLPIMKRMSNAYSVASGTYMRTPGLTESLAQRNAINRVLLDEFKKLGIESDKDRPEDKVEDCIDKFKLHIYDTYKMSYMQAIELLFAKDNDVLHDISKNGLFDESTNYYKVTVNDQDRKLTGLEVQLLVAIAKSLFDPYAQALADLVKYSKIDTAKQGKNIQEQREYLLGYHRIFDDESVAFSRKAFVAKGLNNMRDNSYVGVKTLNATSAFLSALEDQLIEATHSFALDCDFILSTIGKDDTLSKTLLNTIAKKAAIKIKSNYFFGPGGFCEQFGIDPKGLVSGNNTIYDRLNKLRVMILSDPKYAELVDASGEINNYLLRSLTLSYTYTYNPRLNPAQGNRPDTYPTAKFIKLFNFTEEDTIDQDSIIEAWEELLNDGKFPELQEFARDLIVYSFMTAGDAGGMTDIFKYVPNSWKINPMGAGYESSYAFFIENELKQRKDSVTGMFSMEDVLDILQNCWYNDDIITTLYSIPKTIDQITLAGQSHPLILIPKTSTFLPYMFKVPREKASDKFSLRHYSMYKMVEINGKIVYVEVDPKGMKFPFGHYIYEMSRQDNQYSDAVVSLLLDPNMSALAKQFGLSTDSIQSFLNDLVEKLNEQPQLGPALVEGNVLSKNISELSNVRIADNVAPDTRPVPQDQEPQAEINIYAGDNENADLSNFAERPFKTWYPYHNGKPNKVNLRQGERSFTKNVETDWGFTKGNPQRRKILTLSVSDVFGGSTTEQFKTVEGAFQAAKLAFIDLENQDSPYFYYKDSLSGSARPMLTEEGEQLIKRLQKATGAEAKSIGRQIKGLNKNLWDSNSSEIMKELLRLSFLQNPQALQRLLATGNATLTHTQDKGKWGTEFPRLLMEVRDELRREQSSAELNNAKDNANDQERFAGVAESEQTISSKKTILSNEELKYWNEHGVDNMPRILVASERTDPAFHVNEILDILDGKKSVDQWGVVNGRRLVVGLLSGKDFAGLYLITKHDGIPMKKLLETKIPKLIHFSITGLGGTKYEPGVMKPDDLLDRIKEYINMGLDPESITIRIDPIIPGVTTPRMIENIIKHASEMGIKRIRFSIMDAYPNTVIALEKIGYDFEANYGTNPASGKYNFNAKPEKFDKIVEFMLQMADKYGVTLGSCAENIARRGISKEGCLSVSAVNKMLGTSIEDKGTGNNDLRKLCSCYGGKIDALAYGKNCASHCIYCYAKHENDVAMQYYNEDGTLKDNQFTRTSNQQSAQLQTQKHRIADSIKIHSGDWSRAEAQNNPRTLYVFTDNTDRDSGHGLIPDNSWYSKKYGIGHHFPTMTAAVVRGLDNSRPISTQRWYHPGAKGVTGRWTDADVEEFQRVIRAELQDIVEEFGTGKYDTIMFPDGDGLFNTSISNITKARTPKLYQALADLLHEYGFDSLIPADVTPTQQVQQQPALLQPVALNSGRITGSDENSDSGAEFSPGNIEDAVAKSLTSKLDDTVQEPDENGIIQGKLGVDKSQLIALLGNTMYTASVQDVAEKELVQNAFDATKIAIAQGLIKKGKITVELDSKQRTVTITDNGSGMTPEIVLKAFFTIGGSYKGENTDNRLKSGGLGLAKMAFLFTADYVELTTVKDGKKVYVKATPQLIQNDDFKIIVSSTNEPNGTSVSVKVPETYLDQEGNERSIYFSTWGDGFFNNPMIGNVEVTRIVDGKEKWTRDFNKIPEGYTMIGTATSDFGDIEIYKDFSHETSDYKVLISGLYLFNDWVNGEGTHYATIINILPSVGTKSEVYPINNQREGFRSTIKPEIEDLEYFLKKLDDLFERKKLKTSFGSSFNMDSESLENIELKSDVTTEDLIKEVLNDIKLQYKPISTKISNQDDDSENFGIELNTLTEERKESEKKRRSSFDTSSIPIEELNQYVDTSNLDLLKAVFYNNTTFKPSKNTIEFLTLFGSMLILLRNSFLALLSNNLHYKAVAENMKTQYWGVAIDKDYNGVNVSPSLFNFLGLNPISMASMILKEGIIENFEYVLEELLFHNILHETNHNAVGMHNENFTIQFQYTYSEFAKIGEGLYTWRKLLRNLIKQYLKDIIEDAKKYDLSTNVGESLEGRSLRIKTQKSSQSSVENNEQAIYGSEDIGILSDAIKHFVNNKLGRSSMLLLQLKSLGAELMDKCKG